MMMKWGNGSAEIYRRCIFHIRPKPNLRLWKTSDQSFKQESQSYASVEIGSYCDQWLLRRCWNEAMDGLHTTMICLFLAEVGKRCPLSNSVKARCHKSRPTAAPDGAPCHSVRKRKKMIRKPRFTRWENSSGGYRIGNTLSQDVGREFVCNIFYQNDIWSLAI